METGIPPVGDLDDVYQENEPAFNLPSVRVTVEGPVQTHAVPSRSGGSRTYPMLAVEDPKRVGNEDPRRRRLRIIADQIFYVGETVNEVKSRYAARWPAGTVCEVTHMEAVYVQVIADGNVSVMTENWAD